MAGPRIKSGGDPAIHCLPGDGWVLLREMPGSSPLLSGLGRVDRVHGLDSTGFLQDLLNRSSKWSPSHALSGYGFRRFDEGVSRAGVSTSWWSVIGADYRVRRLSSWSQLQAMVFCQLSGSRSLREVVGALERFPKSHAHLGMQPVRRSTLADANRVRPPALFEDVLEALVRELGRSSGRRGREMLRLVDATRVLVGKRIESWEADGCVKLHVVYDPGADTPVCFAVTSVRTNDITPAKRSPSSPARHTSSTRATTTSASGLRSTPRSAASSPV